MLSLYKFKTTLFSEQSTSEKTYERNPLLYDTLSLDGDVSPTPVIQ